MAWYKTGTVSITNGSTSVTGTGTKFATNARVGDGFTGPDGKWYEVTNIASETTLAIYPAYQGVTVSNSAIYTIAPLQGYNKESADRLRIVTDGISDISADVAAAQASADAALASEVAADASKVAANASKVAAATSETNALASKNAAATSEANALTSKNAASSSATSASTSATNAANSATAAANSAQDAADSASANITSQDTAESAGDNFIVNNLFHPSGSLNPSASPNGTTTFVDNTAVGVPAGCPLTHMAVNTKGVASQLYATSLIIRGGLGYQRVTGGETLDLSVIMACTGNLTTGSATARLVVIETDTTGALVANTRALAYDNVAGGWQRLSGSLVLQPTTARVAVGMWSETAMPVGGKIYFGEVVVSKRGGGIAALHTIKMDKANPRFTGNMSVSLSNTEPLQILTSGYTTGLAAYNAGQSGGNAGNAFVSQAFSFSTANLAPQFIGARSYGAQGVHGAVASGRSCVSLMGLASDGTAYQPIARMDAYTEELTTSTNAGGEWQVWTTPIGANRPTLAARFRHNGAFEPSGPVNEAVTQTVASAATLNLATTTSNTVAVTGTTAITALGTMPAGVRRVLKFASALTLTHNSSSLKLPGNANINTNPDDTCEMQSLGSGAWVCNWYTKRTGQPNAVISVAQGGTGVTTSTGTGSNVHSVSPALTGAPTAPTATPGTDNTQVATTEFVYEAATYSGYKNRVINGAMNIVQRAPASFAGGTSGYAGPDRFRCVNGVSAGGQFTQSSGSLTHDGYSKATVVQTVNTAIVSTATTNHWQGINQLIEGINCYDMVGMPIALSFVFMSNISGTFSVNLRDGTSAYSYNNTFAATANVPLKVEFLIPANASLNIPRSNASGFSLGIGALNTGTYQTSGTGWQAGNFLSSTGATNWAATAGNFIAATDIQLEIGEVVSSFDRRPSALERMICMRYFEIVGGTVTANKGNYVTNTYKVPKRATPTITLASGSLSGADFDNYGGSIDIFRLPAGVLPSTTQDYTMAINAEL